MYRQISDSYIYILIPVHYNKHIKEKEYYELPDRLQFYISETDIWKEGGIDIMCEVAERIEARGRAQGEKIGRRQGEKIGREQGEKIGREKKACITAQNLYQMGMSPEKIAQAVGEDISMVRQWLGERL